MRNPLMYLVEWLWNLNPRNRAWLESTLPTKVEAASSDLAQHCTFVLLARIPTRLG